ncbi:dipeptide epimerase [Sphingomonas sp. LaA6.9]|uniref:dipeptide epimerase n=1 Tax=Sphingomonas sp. LaA6.9 TaxID=2919914 RepID=UPI001F4FF89C|nr:dipeptide epimerase [Sphingomonas sp. LaA6.9]MCJ8157747.1 dipeptide epimerase [Sphingomonas sp. LaA6.9]
MSSADKHHGIRLELAVEQWNLKAPFRISGHVFSQHQALVVALHDGDLVGRGEAAGVYYRGDDVTAMVERIERVRGAIEAGIGREELQHILPAGGARNALDCALWDLEAKRAGCPLWRLAGLEKPGALITTFTFGAEAPAVVGAGARASDFAALKLKLCGDQDDAARVRAARAARPEAWIGVDANQGLDRAGLERLIPVLVDAGVSLIEQPLPVGSEADLEGLDSPIAIAADETVQTLADVAAFAGSFDVINIKLDKCGGLTEALAMAHEARRLGLQVMVGNMIGTSLAMAPAWLVGQQSTVVDLDGPLHLTSDRTERATYRDGQIHCGDAVWGGATMTGQGA